MEAAQSKPSRGFTELIGKALTDPAFRDELYRDRGKAVAAYQLSPADQETLKTLSKETLEKHAEQFAKGTATALTISIVIRIKF
jgi:hypothetical protein